MSILAANGLNRYVNRMEFASERSFRHAMRTAAKKISDATEAKREKLRKRQQKRLAKIKRPNP